MEGSVTFRGPGFQALRQKLDPVLREHMRECGELTCQFAKHGSPFITGHNRRSVTVDFFKDGSPDGVKAEGEFDGANNGPTPPPGVGETFRVYTQSGYGGHLETGTSKMQAQPYIKPGFDRAVAMLKQDLVGAADKAGT